MADLVDAAAIQCRCCGATGSMQCLGPLPPIKKFAGVFYEAGFQSSSLLRCILCRSMQRHPVYAQDFYQKLYQSEGITLWTGDTLRLDHVIVRDIVASSGAASVLDIGCGNGDFLRTLPDGVERFAIEPSGDAAEQLLACGISVVATDFRAWPFQRHYGCVTAIDVIEHLEYPAQLLDTAMRHLEPGGLLIISTGNPESWPWRSAAGARYWYSAPQEHISFPSPTFMRSWACEHRHRVMTEKSFRYRRLGLRDWMLRLASQGSYFIFPKLHQWLGRAARRSARGNDLANYINIVGDGVFEDHYVVAVRKAGP